MVQILSKTILSKPVDVTGINHVKRTGKYKARLMQIDYFSDSLEIFRLYFKICNGKRKDRYAVWTCLNTFRGQYRVRAIIRALNGSKTMNSDYQAGKFNDDGELFNSHDPLGKECQIKVHYNANGPFKGAFSDITVQVPDTEKGDYYV